MGKVDVEKLERRAEEVLAEVPSWLWDGESVPVPVEDIADSHFGLLVRDVPDLRTAPGCPSLDEDQTLSGLLLAGPGEIWVNQSEGERWPGRRRFTICHELGHHVLHRDQDGDIFCRASHVEPKDFKTPTHDDDVPDIEEEASVFAAALLMPARLMRREYQRSREFQSLCERFGASGAAMGRRLHRVI